MIESRCWRVMLWRSRTTLRRSIAYAQFWIEGKNIIGPLSGSQSGAGYWAYPKGGSPKKELSGQSPFGATVSLY